jgi:hypothetical protein
MKALSIIVYVWVLGGEGKIMVFNATFNNISAISWRSVLLVGETGVPGENHRPVASHWQLTHTYVNYLFRNLQEHVILIYLQTTLHK